MFSFSYFIILLYSQFLHYCVVLKKYYTVKGFFNYDIELTFLWTIMFLNHNGNILITQIF